MYEHWWVFPPWGPFSRNDALRTYYAISIICRSWNSHYFVTYIVYLIVIYGGTGVCLLVLIMIQHFATNVLPNFSNSTDCWFASGKRNYSVDLYTS